MRYSRDPSVNPSTPWPFLYAFASQELCAVSGQVVVETSTPDMVCAEEVVVRQKEKDSCFCSTLSWRSILSLKSKRFDFKTSCGLQRAAVDDSECFDANEQALKETDVKLEVQCKRLP